jgi:hypothetical protein
MKITVKQFRKIIRECACEAIEGMGMPPVLNKDIQVISFKALPKQEEINSTLFPGLGHKNMDGSHGDLSDDQGEKSMIVGNLHKLADRAGELAQMTSEVPDNEEWVQEKIAVASAMIDSIYSYMKYNKGE